VELTPRTGPEASSRVSARERRSPWAYGALVVVLIGLGVVAYEGLTSATLYFYNADEAVAQKADLGDKRFRLQGMVRDDVQSTAKGVTFTVEFNGVDVPVRNEGDPPELFAPGLPVVLEGRWAPNGEVYESDRILVKHSEQYKADNGDRLDDAKDARSDNASTP
jgi:cytochrome c-type biogenesis protein CcmE